MSEKSLVEATRQLPCSVVILSATDKKGVMTASAMYVSEMPPLIAVSVESYGIDCKIRRALG